MSWLITPGQPVPLDPYRSNVSLLLHGDGANGSTAIVDSSPTPKTATANGNAQISMTQSKFGGASIAFDGTDDRLTIPRNIALNFGTGDFTVELWVRFNEIKDSGFFGCTGTGSSGEQDFAFVSNSLRIGRLDTAWDSTFAWTPVINTWYHVAFCRQNTTARCFVDGSQVGSNSTNANNYFCSSTHLIGHSSTVYGGSSNRMLNGYIDELRITKGVARYTANFTPPTAPFPDI